MCLGSKKEGVFMEKKILLVVPPCFMSRALDFEIGFPVHLSTLGHVARGQGWSVEYLDMTLEEKDGADSFHELERCLEDGAIKLVGISNHTVRTSVTTRVVAERVKTLRPEVPVVVGGVNATFMWRELMDWCPAIDYVLRGYAQAGLRALLRLIDGSSSDAVPGLVRRRGGELLAESLSQVSPDDLNFPLPGGLDVERYLSWTKTYPLLTHTGCGFSCNFCTSVMPGPYQSKEVYRATDDIVAEMVKAVDMGFSRFFMSANTFTSRKDRALELCEAVRRAGLPDRGVTWVCMTRIELVDESLLRSMFEAGCVNIAFGVESTGSDQWNSLNKGRYSEQRVTKAFNLTKESGIGTSAYLMLGAPEQTEADVEATVDAVRELNPDYRVISFFQPFPGTPYWQNPEKYGLSDIAPLEEWNFHEAPLCRTRHFEKPELVNAATRLYLDRGGPSRLDPRKHAIKPIDDSWRTDASMPRQARAAFDLLDGYTAIDVVLEQVSASHQPRGRLIALYWLSAGLRDGSLQVVDPSRVNLHTGGTQVFQSAALK
jgi:anaerobic magnesium-protoporphyrin IX monomethyl ester cyclase